MSLVVIFVDEKNKSQQGSCFLREKEGGPRVTGGVGTPLVTDFIYLTEGTVRCKEQRQTPPEWFSPGLNWVVLCFAILQCWGQKEEEEEEEEGKGLKEKAPWLPFLPHQN